jgi:hypothetical protein
MPLLWAGFSSLFLSLPCDVPTDSARGGSNGITFSISIIYTLGKPIALMFCLILHTFGVWKAYIEISENTFTSVLKIFRVVFNETLYPVVLHGLLYARTKEKGG